MTELTIDGLTPKELEAAKESLIALYELRDEYAKAKRYLDRVELQMAQRYDTVNRVLDRIKERKGAESRAMYGAEHEGNAGHGNAEGDAE